MIASSTADVAAASGLFGHRAARFASARTLGGADPSATLAGINSRAAAMIVNGNRTGALALLSEPKTAAAARATGHLGGLHAAIGVLLDPSTAPAARGMGQDPYSAVIGAVATAVGQVAQAVPATINAVNGPKTQKEAEQAQEVMAQTQAQASVAQTQAWAQAAPYVAGAAGIGLLGLAAVLA